MVSSLKSNSVSTPRIAYVVKRYPRFSETFIVNEVLAHEEAGVDVSIFSLNQSTDTHFQPAISQVKAPVSYLRAANIRAREFWKLLDYWLKKKPVEVAKLASSLDTQGTEVYQALDLALQIESQGIEHLHAHFATSATTVARLASLLTGVPYTFTAHAKDIFHECVDHEALQQKIGDAAAVITVSDFNAGWLAESFPDHAEKIVRVFNGLPLSRFPLRKPRQTTASQPLVVAVGRLVEKKGFDDLIRSCKLLRERNLDFQCLIVGGGELDGSLRRQIDQSGVSDQVRLTGSLPSDRVLELLRKATILVAPCVTASTGDRDGMPTILLEAMATGTPVLATSVTGIPEIVRNDETGRLVPERSPEQLANAMQELITDKLLGQHLAYRARRMIEEDFDVKQNAADLRQIFLATDASDQSFAEAV